MNAAGVHMRFQNEKRKRKKKRRTKVSLSSQPSEKRQKKNQSATRMKKKKGKKNQQHLVNVVPAVKKQRGERDAGQAAAVKGRGRAEKKSCLVKWRKSGGSVSARQTPEQLGRGK